MWVSTHPSFWRQTAESGCSSSSRPPCLHQCHGRYSIKNTDVRQIQAPTSPLSDGDEKNLCTKVTQMKREPPPKKKRTVTAVLERISSPLMLRSVRVTLEGQEHNKICFQPSSLSQLSYPWVWYPPPFPLCSLWPLSPSPLLFALYCQMKNSPTLASAKRLSKLWLSGGIHPPTLLNAGRHVRLCVYMVLPSFREYVLEPEGIELLKYKWKVDKNPLVFPLSHLLWPPEEFHHPGLWH